MQEIIDDKDKKILEILKDHADYSTRDISKKVLLPITTVHHRIQKLKKAGVIKKYTVELDNSKTDNNFVAYVLISVNIALLKEKKKSQYKLLSEIRKFYFVERADIVSGGTDIVVLMRVRDVQEFDNCLLNKLQLVEGIEKTQSLIVIHEQ
ncbi:MAG TPA: Lrp/AsnC family transcriptional regulator [Alphaproteobacteria bacterium]|nr:Lrp/AsnC family transcriptional regulator [Alphaproteobacteria bacterium]